MNCLPVTVTVHVAVIPLEVDAVITAVPSLTAFTAPLFVTVATAVLSDVHVTVLFVALLGVTVAVSESELPAMSSSEVLLSVMPVGFTISGLSVTVTVHVAVFPLFDFAVIVAVPFDTP